MIFIKSVTCGGLAYTIKSFNSILKKFIESNLSNNDSPLLNYLSDISVGFAITDNNGNLKYINKEFEKIFLYSNQELINQKVEKLIPNDKTAAHVNLRNEYAKKPVHKKMGENRNLKGLRKDGKQIFLELGLHPVPTKENNHFILVAKDISLEVENDKKFQRANEILDITTNSIPSILIYIDKNEDIIFANAAFDQLLSIEQKAKNCTGKNLWSCIPKVIAEELKPLIKKVSVNSPEKKELSIGSKANETLLFDFSITYHSGEHGGGGYIIQAHDITEHKENLSKLENINNQLEEFAFLISHDLRAPVRHITNFVDLLANEINSLQVEKDNIKIDKFKNIILQNTDKVQQMITGMLKIVSIRSIKPKLECVDIKEFLNAHLKNSFEREFSYSLSKDFEEDPIIKADTDILEHIFNNLILNSLKFTDQNIVPKIDLILKNTINGELQLDYFDNGPGLDEGIKKRLFTPFSKSGSSEGLGLGLVIVQRSLKALNATIENIPNNDGIHFRMIFQKEKSF